MAGETAATHDAGSGTGQDGLNGGTAGFGGGDAAAIRLHDAEGGALLERGCKASEVAGHQWGDVGVDGGGGPALELAVLGEDFMRGGDVKAGSAEGCGQGLLMRGVRIGVQQADGH